MGTNVTDTILVRETERGSLATNERVGNRQPMAPAVPAAPGTQPVTNLTDTDLTDTPDRGSLEFNQRRGSGGDPDPPPPDEVTLASIEPVSIPSGSNGIELTVYGTGFTEDTEVLFNGTAVAETTFVYSSKLTTMVDAEGVSVMQVGVTGTDDTRPLTFTEPEPPGDLELIGATPSEWTEPFPESVVLNIEGREVTETTIAEVLDEGTVVQSLESTEYVSPIMLNASFDPSVLAPGIYQLRLRDGARISLTTQQMFLTAAAPQDEPEEPMS